MRSYFEDEGMTIIAAFEPEPGDPPQVTWTVTAEGKDGAVIKFWANSLGRSLNVTRMLQPCVHEGRSFPAVP